MKECIFCGQTENDFANNNNWTEEHIIPKSLGNNTLKIYDVCKECNSGLGTYVDNYFVNNKIIEIIRHRLNLKGQSGKVPNPFKEGKDEYGHLIRTDHNFHPQIVPSLKNEDGKIEIVASTVEEAQDMMCKILRRKGYTNEEIENLINNAVHTSKEYQPTVKYETPIEIHRIYMEVLKIAYEYTFYKLGCKYLKDETAKKIKQFLRKAIDGGMKEECLLCPYVCILPDFLFNSYKQHIPTISHVLFLRSEAEGRLVVDMILFMEKIFSFSVCVSNDASQYKIVKNFIPEIIEIFKDIQ